jgi:cytochrome b
MSLGVKSNTATGSNDHTVRVWDLFVRTFHWTLVVAFFVAYTTEDDLLTLHVWAGYAVGGLLMLRVLWGFVGPKHARFSDFLYAPATVKAYLRDLIGFRARRYLGHSPAGGAMVFALMIGLAATVWTGLEFYADAEGKGPLASASTLVAPAAAGPVAGARLYLASADEKDGDEGREAGRDGLWEDLHEALAHLTFLLVLAHLGGVALASFVHRENLVRAMISGRKRAEE